MTVPRSDAIIFFGAAGDLAHKQIIPALYAMVRRGHLNIPIVGLSRAGWNLEQFQNRVRDSLEKQGKIDPEAFRKMLSLLRYVDGDFREMSTYMDLCRALGGAQQPLYYLAIPPSMFAPVAECLSRSGCTREARVVLEKPFGRDLASARELNHTLNGFYPEESIFRIDHYLGKEPVLNLIYFRFANPFVEAGWDNRHIESVQITMAETFGVGTRGKVYEEMGAIRDVFQNHMLTVLACLTAECPERQDHAAQIDARARLMQQVRTLDASNVVRGQYRGYRQEAGVAPDSQVETFAAVRFFIDNERWYGVPFYVRAGKCLPVTSTEVLVRTKRPLRPVLDETGPPQSNYYRFRLSPETVLALGIKSKIQGERMVGERVELVAHANPPDPMKPYERLLSDAARGDPTLFTRWDVVEASWRIVDPVLGNAAPLYEYEPRTWGPPEVDSIGAPEGGWYNPRPMDKPVDAIGAAGLNAQGEENHESDPRASRIGPESLAR